MMKPVMQVIWDALLQWLRAAELSNLHDEALMALAVIARRQCMGPNIKLQSRGFWDMLPFQHSLSSAALLFCEAVPTSREIPAYAWNGMSLSCSTLKSEYSYG